MYVTTTIPAAKKFEYEVLEKAVVFRSTSIDSSYNKQIVEFVKSKSDDYASDCERITSVLYIDRTDISLAYVIAYNTPDDLIYIQSVVKELNELVRDDFASEITMTIEENFDLDVIKTKKAKEKVAAETEDDDDDYDEEETVTVQKTEVVQTLPRIETLKPSLRFMRTPDFLEEAQKFYEATSLIKRDSESDWIYKYYVERLEERFPLIARADHKLCGMISEIFTLVSENPKNPPSFKSVVITMANGNAHKLEEYCRSCLDTFKELNEKKRKQEIIRQKKLERMREFTMRQSLTRK